jgi:hypothetical protein
MQPPPATQPPPPARTPAAAAAAPPRAAVPPPANPRPTPQTFGPAHSGAPSGAASASKPPERPAARPSRSALPVLSALGFLLLLAGLGWVWNSEQKLEQRLAELAQPPAPAAATPAIDPARIAAIETQVKELTQRVAAQPQTPGPGIDPARIAALEDQVKALAQRPAEPPQAAASADSARIAALEDQVKALAQRPAEPAQAAPPSADPARIAALESQLKDLTQHMSELQQHPAPPIAPLEARVAALESRKPDTAASDKLAEQLNSVAAEATAAKAAEAAMTSQLAELDGRLKQTEQREGTLAQQAAQASDQAAQARRVAQAQVALEVGEPLGDLPGAQPTLARFAHVKPPTEAALRLSFPAAADAAEAASRPSTEGKTLGERMWLHARSLVTVTQGDKVVVGPPAATILGDAHAKLEAGDLAGALAALDALDPPAAAAMSSWRSQAQALLDARAALAQMARG